MGHKILIETDILIDISREISTAINRINKEKLNNKLCISVITKMELIIGCRNKIEQQKLNKFLQGFLIINVNESISHQEGQLLEKYRLSHGLLIADALIAATAIILDIPLLSKNQNDYRFIDEINLLPYP